MRRLGWKRYLIGSALMLLLQVFSILIQAQGEMLYAYGFNFVLSLGVMMWSAKLFEDRQRTFGRYMRGYLPYLLQVVCVIATDFLIVFLVSRTEPVSPLKSFYSSADMMKVLFFSFAAAGLPYILIQILCAVIGFLIACGFSLADFINRRR